MTDHFAEVESVVSIFFAKWKRQMKVAMVIANILDHFRDIGIAIGEDEAAQHLYRLIDEGDFETYGDIKNWRYSEIAPRQYLKPD